MKKTLVLAAVAAILASCEAGPHVDPLTKLQNQLPKGCTIRDLGEYRKIDQVLVVDCSNRSATVVNTFERKSKHNKVRVATVMIDD